VCLLFRLYRTPPLLQFCRSSYQWDFRLYAELDVSDQWKPNRGDIKTCRANYHVTSSVYFSCFLKLPRFPVSLMTYDSFNKILVNDMLCSSSIYRDPFLWWTFFIHLNECRCVLPVSPIQTLHSRFTNHFFFRSFWFRLEFYYH
jgi:hypothetical protein